MKKIIVVLLSVLLLCSCGTSTSSSTAVSSSNKDNETILVGIVQLLPHEALDAATQGFKDALTAEFGDKVVFEEGNAAGESANCATIVDGFVNDGVDLILANATASLQAAASATNTIPVLGTSITDYMSALGLDSFDGVVGGNVSGTSDLAPLDLQADMIVDLLNPGTVGILYCSNEPNSVYQTTEVQKLLEEKGIEVKLFSFADSNDIASVTQQAVSESDCLYIPTDNTAAAYAETIYSVAGNTPIIAGEEGLCKKCGIATLSISYYDLGVATGEMAVKILKGEEDISSMAVQYAKETTYKYNPVICEALGITVPDNYVAIDME